MILYDYLTENQIIKTENDKNLTVQQIVDLVNNNTSVFCKSYNVLKNKIELKKVILVKNVASSIINPEYDIKINSKNLQYLLHLNKFTKILNAQGNFISVVDLTINNEIMTFYRTIKYGLELISNYTDVKFTGNITDIVPISNLNLKYYIQLEDDANMFVNNCAIIKITKRTINDFIPTLQVE